MAAWWTSVLANLLISFRKAPNPWKSIFREALNDSWKFAASAGEDGRQAGQARPILLADAGREPSHAAVVREHGPAHRCAGGGDRVVGGRVTPAKSGDQDVEVGDVFVEITEKTQFPGFRFFRRVEFGAWQRQEKAPGEKTALGNCARRSKTWG